MKKGLITRVFYFLFCFSVTCIIGFIPANVSAAGYIPDKDITADDIIAADVNDMIVYPHFGTPVFSEPGQQFTAEVAASASYGTTGWSAWLENDLKRWDCTVGTVEYGANKIYLDSKTGYRINVTVPSGITPELCTLVLQHNSGKILKAPMSVSIVPELDSSFYTMNVTDTHFFRYGGAAANGQNDGKSIGLMAKVGTLAGARFFSHTGDISLSGEVSRAVGVRDYMMQPIVQMGRVPFILAEGNHEYDPYVAPIPSTTTGTRTGDYDAVVGDRYFGMRSQVMGMGSFAVTKHFFGAYNGDLPLRANITTKWNSVFASGSPYTYRLLLQHAHDSITALFYPGNNPPSISPNPSLILKGHDHSWADEQSSPYYVLSLGGGDSSSYGACTFLNFNLSGSSWSCAQATTAFGTANKINTIVDARDGYDITALRDSYSNPNNGTASGNTCTITNDINFNFYDGRIRFLMAQGSYSVTGGTILKTYDYEEADGSWHTAVLAKVDIAPQGTTTVSISSGNETVDDYNIGIAYFSNWNPVFTSMDPTAKLYGRINDWFGGVRDHITQAGPWGNGPIADREPLLGWYNDQQQSTIDQHILQAASRGIDYFSFYYYWKVGGGGERPGQNIYNYLDSDYNDLIKFNLMFISDSTWPSSDWDNYIIPKIVSFMQEPQYVKSPDGRPVLNIFGELLSHFNNSEAQVNSALGRLRTAVQNAGLPNPVILSPGVSNEQSWINQGFDGMGPLNLAGVGLFDNEFAPENYSVYTGGWQDFVDQHYSDYMFVPGQASAFDSRGWAGVSSSIRESERYVYTEPNPDKFRVHLENVREYLDSHPNSMNMALFYAWNELGEGGVIEPTTLYGYGYLNAIQEVFGLDNSAYNSRVTSDGLSDLDPDLRLEIIPEHPAAVNNQVLNIKIKATNKHSAQITSGTVSLNSGGWQVISSTGTDLSGLAAGASKDVEFSIRVVDGSLWQKQQVTASAAYSVSGQQKNAGSSAFFVRVPAVNGVIEPIFKPVTAGDTVDIGIRIRNYTFGARQATYKVSVPAGWSIVGLDKGTVTMDGYSQGPEWNRIKTMKHRIRIPSNAAEGTYVITLDTDSYGVKTQATINIRVSNSIYNPSFEQDADSNGIADIWVSAGDPALSLSTDKVDGSRSRRIQAAGWIKGIHQEWTQIEPGRNYVAEAWIKVESGALRFCDVEAASDYGWLGENAQVVVNPSGWQKYTLNITPLQGSENIGIRFDSYADGNTVAYVDQVVLKPASRIARAWEFNTAADTEGWAGNFNVSGLTANGSFLNGNVTGIDPALTSGNNLNVSITGNKLLKVRLKNSSSSTNGKVYFITNSDGVWGEDKAKVFSITANDSGYTEYTIDMSTVAKWTGTLKQLRIDPNEGQASGAFSIDYITIGSDSVAALPANPDPQPVPAPQSVRNWEFNTAGNAEGWTANGNIGNAAVSGGYYTGNITGLDPALTSGDNLNCSMADGNLVVIRARNNTASTSGQIYFTTTADTAWNEAKHVDFTLVASDPGYTEYVIDMSQLLSNWTGTLKQLRIDPGVAVSSGSFSIDYIRIVRY